jgi:dTDP-D-glucose 4,6-dehydratase
MINEMTGNKAGICFAKKRKWDTKSRRLASIDKARNLVGYEPRTSFQIGLARAVQWFRDNWDEIDRAARFEPGVSSAVRDFAVAEPPATEVVRAVKVAR